MICIILSACLTEHAELRSTADTPNRSIALPLDVLKNAEYHSDNFTETIRLADGIFYPPPLSGEPQSDWFVMLDEPVAFGDINADGIPDAAVILKSRFGGTGTFRELAAVVNENGEPRNTATAVLGDRVIVNAIHIQNGEIILEMVLHGPDDGLCCPSLKATWTFKLSGNNLLKSPSP